MRGQVHGSLWSQYQQEPQPGALDYLSLLTRPRPDTLGFVPRFWLGAEKLPHLPRPFCCQHLVTGLLFNRIFRFPGSWIWPHTTDDPSYSIPETFVVLVSDYASQSLVNTGVDQYYLELLVILVLFYTLPVNGQVVHIHKHSMIKKLQLLRHT